MMIVIARFAASPALLPVVIPCAGVERYRPRDRYDDRRRRPTAATAGATRDRRDRGRRLHRRYRGRDDYDRRDRGRYRTTAATIGR